MFDPIRSHAVLAFVLATGLATVGDAAGITKAEYNAARDRAAAEYKTMRGRCDELSGNGKDVCVAEAKAFEAKRKAEAEASYRNSEKAVRNARLAAVDADYSVAKARCDARTGNEKSVCVAEATAARRKAKADAEAAAKMNEVRRDVAEEKSDADYKVALEKCNLLGGAAKDSCVSDAKARYSR